MQNTDHGPVARLLRKDVSLWQGSGASARSLTGRLGWLDAVEWMDVHGRDIMGWAKRTVEEWGFERVVVLGMGGSSLAADVFASVHGPQPGYPELTVLDTTSPEQIEAVDPGHEKTLFIVSSKSGTTVETASLYFWFFQQVSDLTDAPGSHFVAITDQDSWLQQQGEQNGFLEVFLNPPDIGGRYSALSNFGLVPAALLGVDLTRIAAGTRAFRQAIVEENGASGVLQLASALVGSGPAEFNKVFLDLAPGLRSMGPWIEQLVAESSGKGGKGILPVCDNQPVTPDSGLVTVAVGYRDEHASGPGDVAWDVEDEYQLGAEFLRWEMAIALACGELGVNPFDQPDVDSAKIRSREFVEGDVVLGMYTAWEGENFALQGIGENRGTAPGPSAVFDRFRSETVNCAYLGILAYLPMVDDVEASLQRLRMSLGEKTGLTTTLGYGPRYLHSTGQLHKGGPPGGCFIQLVEEVSDSQLIPGREYGFARLHRAQADGDVSVLAERGRPVLRIKIHDERRMALDNLTKIVSGMSTF